MKQRVLSRRMVVITTIVLMFIFSCLSASAETQTATNTSEESTVMPNTAESTKKEITILYAGFEKDQIEAFYNAWTADVQSNLGRFCYPTPYELQSLLKIINPRRIHGPDATHMYAVTRPLKVTISGTPVEFSFLVLDTHYQQGYHIIATGNKTGLCRVNVTVEPVAVTKDDFMRVASQLKTSW